MAGRAGHLIPKTGQADVTRIGSPRRRRAVLRVRAYVVPNARDKAEAPEYNIPDGGQIR